MCTKKLLASFMATLLAVVALAPVASATPLTPDWPAITHDQEAQDPQSSQSGEVDSPESDGAQSEQLAKTGTLDPRPQEEPTEQGRSGNNQLSTNIQEWLLEAEKDRDEGSKKEPESDFVELSSSHQAMALRSAAATPPGFNNPTQIGHGWAGLLPIFGGNANRSAPSDLYAINTRSGQLLFYARHSDGSFYEPSNVGHGWDGLRQVTSGVDFTGDAISDIIAIDSSGKLLLYRGSGTGAVSFSHYIGAAGWDGMRLIAAVPQGPGGRGAIYAVRSDGALFLYPTDGRGRITDTRKVGHGWGSMRFLVGSKDWDGDGHSDLFAVRNDGKLFFYQGRADGVLEEGKQAGNGWDGFSSVIAGETKTGVPALWGVAHGGQLLEYSQASHVGPDIVALTRKHIGKRYVYGTAGPNTFDCSGLVSYVYREAGTPFSYRGRWRLTSEEIRYAARVISRSEARPGDILWWPGHVGIYVGNNRMINAPHTGARVREESIWGTPVYLRYPR